VRETIHVFAVENLAKALAVTIRDTALEEGRLLFGASQIRQVGGDTPH